MNACLLSVRNGLEKVARGFTERDAMGTGCGFGYLNLHRYTQINLCTLRDRTLVDTSKLYNVPKNLNFFNFHMKKILTLLMRKLPLPYFQHSYYS